MRSKILLSGVAAAAFNLLAVYPAYATLMVTVTDNGTGVTMTPTTDGGTGSLSSSGSNASFSQIGVQAAGFPIEAAPNLATTTLDVTTATGFTGTHTLTVTVTQSPPDGTFPGGPAQTTFTFNGLIGGPFTSATQTQVYNGSAIDTRTVTGLSGVQSFGPDATAVGVYSGDAQIFTTTFTGAGQTYQGTIQFQSLAQGVPEPSSLGLLGSGLAMLGFLGWRRRHSDAAAV